MTGPSMEWSGRAPALLAGGTEDKEHAMSQKLDTSPAMISVDIGKNSFHVVGHDRRGAIVLRQKCIIEDLAGDWRRLDAAY
jgi:hypothetical protein